MSVDDLYKEYSSFLNKKDISYLVARKEIPVLNEIKKILDIRYLQSFLSSRTYLSMYSLCLFDLKEVQCSFQNLLE